VPGDVSPDGNPWAIATTLDGRVRAFNAATGAAIWTSPELGDSIEASVCAMITAYEGVDDVIMVGVNNRFGGSRFVGLDLATGSELWSFDNGGGWNFIGDISGMCTVDYGRQRVYFTSELERWGTRDTVWALEIADGSATRLWSASHAGVNTPAVLVGEKLYVGTDLGDVLAIDIDDGGETWRYTTGDGPVEGFIFPQRNTGLLAFSTSNRVHLVEDTGSAANAVWQPGVDMPGANTPLIRGDRVLVADADGNVYNLDATVEQPAASPFATFGDPARRAAPGLPYFDWRTGLYGVGTPEGVIYVVQTP
jgi:outer membrane protein assembly factor BamB